MKSLRHILRSPFSSLFFLAGKPRGTVSVFVFVFVFVPQSCVKEELPASNTPEGNFEALWQLMDRHYCFFDYKQQAIGVDWDEVHTRYAQKIHPKMSRMQLFEVLAQMIGELRDGHVNLGASFDVGRNWSYYEDYPRNFSADLIEDYLGTGSDYKIAAGLEYRILDDHIGYVRCSSFEYSIGDGNIDYLLHAVASCHGLIIDVRDNGGGLLTSSRTFASHFTNEKELVGYIYHKTGPGHNDFSSPEPEYVEPSDGIRWQKPVVVLTNRACYSATNDFVKCMKRFPLVTVLGDSTGGGSGMPFMQELPNGWSVRYSAVVAIDADCQHTEFGIAPDTLVSLDSQDRLRGRDTLIEAARALITNLEFRI